MGIPSVDYGPLDEMHRLVAASLAGNLVETERARLDDLVGRDAETCDLYLDVIFESSILLTWAIHGGVRAEIPNENMADQRQGDADRAMPALKAPSCAQAFLPIAFHNTVDYFYSSGWPVAYLIASVIFGVGLLIGASTYVSRDEQVANFSPPAAVGHSIESPSKAEVVGRITGMVDCRRVTPFSETVVGAPVLLNHRYTIASGLMKITYDTGAEVILQGPTTYEAESRNGGFLSHGRLTGKVDADTAKGFTVRTPTATVTDLGTEFGVEVSNDGQTTSHVFRGSVRLQGIAVSEKKQTTTLILHANESARVEGDDKSCRIVHVPTVTSSNFVRAIAKHTVKILDLVDVVAGGDGFSGQRNRGIDPTNGRVVDQLRGRENSPLSGDGQYHRVEEMPFVDGVFIPGKGKNAMQVDSGGRVCDLFRGTTNASWQYVWAGGVMDNPKYPTTVCGVDYASRGHGLIMLTASIGITFDLEAVRRANPTFKLLRFCATVANTGSCPLNSETKYDYYADALILVDGEPRFQRRQIKSDHAGYLALVPIHESDRFLTLVATDGGNGICMDFIIFGDPQLHLLPAMTSELKNNAGP